MTHIEQAIKEAVEKGGYQAPYPNEEISPILLDPLFWQALGRVTTGSWDAGEKNPRWLRMWHRFIDALAVGKSAEQFFAELAHLSGTTFEEGIAAIKSIQNMRLCDYCDKRATSTWDFTMCDGVKIPIAACDQHFERAKLQQETVASREAFKMKLAGDPRLSTG